MATPRDDPLSLAPVPPPAPATHPWRDRALACLFVLAIAVPGLALIITAESTTTQFENRRAATWPTWSMTRAMRGYSAAFERAFADRFGGRDALIRLHHRILVEVFNASPVADVTLGSGGWLYLTPHYDGAAQRVRRNHEFAPIVAAIERRLRYLEALGIDYLLVIVPEKHTIYPEHLPKTAGAPKHDSLLLDSVLAHLPADVRAHVLDLRAPLLAAKPARQVYWRTDSHWNLSGAWLGYQAIHAALRRDGGAPPGVAAMPPEIVTGNLSGDLATMIGLPERFSEPQTVLQYDPAAWKCAKTATGAAPVWGAPKQTLYCPTATLGTAAIYHDSAGIPLLPWLPGDFRVSRWAHSREWNVEELVADKPEIVIDEVVERNLPALADMKFLDRPVAPTGAK